MQDALWSSGVRPGYINGTLIGDSSATAGELAASARVWNAQAGNAGATSKYVTSVRIAEATGEITVTFNATNVGNIPADSTLVFTPYVQNAAGAPTQLGASYAAGVTGSIDWGCASQSNAVSSGPDRNMPALTAGTLPARFAPSECR
ncbi:pilin [Pseudomonas aeruginosa]|uniref:pilin n=1 Tax=Pseudomonas aeruginosa TaxID=287 RepID=UPI001FB78436|nr:pilin [Pseudomonas aeruginosa]MCJ1943155.1 pilin [Pseudomonas aeruginosa]